MFPPGSRPILRASRPSAPRLRSAARCAAGIMPGRRTAPGLPDHSPARPGRRQQAWPDVEFEHRPSGVSRVGRSGSGCRARNALIWHRRNRDHTCQQFLATGGGTALLQYVRETLEHTVLERRHDGVMHVATATHCRRVVKVLRHCAHRFEHLAPALGRTRRRRLKRQQLEEGCRCEERPEILERDLHAGDFAQECIDVACPHRPHDLVLAAILKTSPAGKLAQYFDHLR